MLHQKLLAHYFIGLMMSSFARQESSSYTDYAASLRQQLFVDGRYDPRSGPHGSLHDINDTSQVPIQLRLLVLHILNLDEFTGTLTVNGWFLVSWTDFRLQWNPEENGNVRVIKVFEKTVWRPDITLLNNAEAMLTDTYGDVHVIIYSTGDIFWSVPVTFHVACPIDHTSYPFDEFQCRITMALWAEETQHFALDVHYLDKQDEAELLSRFATENPQWEILSMDQQIENTTFSCCPTNPIPHFVTDLKLRRRAPLTKFLLIAPIVMSILLSLSIFWLPPDSTLKFTCAGFAMAIQITLLLYLGMKISPGGKGAPAIVVVCGNAFVMSALSVIISVIIMRISCKTNPIPSGIKSLLTPRTWLNILCCFVPGFQVKTEMPFSSKVKFARKNQKDFEPLDSERVEMDNNINDSRTTTTVASSSFQSDWFIVGAVIDRLCFIVYCFIFIVIGISSCA